MYQGRPCGTDERAKPFAERFPSAFGMDAASTFCFSIGDSWNASMISRGLNCQAAAVSVRLISAKRDGVFQPMCTIFSYGHRGKCECEAYAGNDLVLHGPTPDYISCIPHYGGSCPLKP